MINSAPAVLSAAKDHRSMLFLYHATCGCLRGPHPKSCGDPWRHSDPEPTGGADVASCVCATSADCRGRACPTRKGGGNPSLYSRNRDQSPKRRAKPKANPPATLVPTKFTMPFVTSPRRCRVAPKKLSNRLPAMAAPSAMVGPANL